ncbi:MAG: hypothetical protein ACREMM_09075 [Gemmatimonadales bacterium]
MHRDGVLAFLLAIQRLRDLARQRGPWQHPEPPVADLRRDQDVGADGQRARGERRVRLRERRSGRVSRGDTAGTGLPRPPLGPGPRLVPPNGGSGADWGVSGGMMMMSR